jgi:chemotaxis protein MotB
MVGSLSSALPRFKVQLAANTSQAQQRTLWLITIVDLVTLLLAFFVLLFAMSHVEGKRYAAVAKSYGDAFNPMLGDEEPLVRLPKIAALPGDNLAYLEVVLRGAFAKTATLKDVEFHRTGQYLILALPVDGVFVPGSGALVDAGQGPVFDLGGVLSNLKNRIAIVGSAVMSPAEGAEAPGILAWELAMARATSLADALTRAGAVQPVSGMGRGGAVGDLAASKGRVEIMILPEQAS